MKREEQTMYRVLAKQRLGALNELLRTVFGAQSRRVLEKKVAIEHLKRAPGGAEQVLRAIRSRAAKAQDEGPMIFQHGRWLVGPLGVRQSAESRTAVQGAALVQLLLRIGSRYGDVRLEEMGRSLTAGVENAVEAIPTSLPRGPSLAQYILEFNDTAVGRALNVTGTVDSVLDLGSGLIFDDQDEDEVLPWLCTRFGVVLDNWWPHPEPRPEWFDDDELAHKLAAVLASERSSALDVVLSGPERLAECVSLVVRSGPEEVVERWLSDARLWDLMTAGGLRLPPLPSISRRDLRRLFFRTLSLNALDQPTGWYSLFRFLEAPGWRTDLDPFELFRQVERDYCSTVGAYLAFAYDDDSGADKMCGSSGIETLHHNLGVSGSHSLRRRTFGQQVRVMESVIKQVGSDVSIRTRFEEAGCDPAAMSALVGSEIFELVALRNALAHGEDPISTGQARDVVLAWLEKAGAGDFDMAFPLPMRVRHRRTVIDSLGWSQVWFDDELGREELAAMEPWDFETYRWYAFGRLNDPLRGLHLIRE